LNINPPEKNLVIEFPILKAGNKSDIGFDIKNPTRKITGVGTKLHNYRIPK